MTLTVTPLYPKHKPKPQVIPLSIHEAHLFPVAPSTSRQWIFSDIDYHRLKNALQLTVDLFPFWTGQLRYVKEDVSSKDPYERYQHSENAFGFETDLGIHLVEAAIAKSVADIRADLAGGHANCHFLNHLPVEPYSELQVMPPASPSTPILTIYLTRLTAETDSPDAVSVVFCGAHMLIDGRSCMVFMQCWQDFYLGKDPSTCGHLPTYDPYIMDKIAFGEGHDHDAHKTGGVHDMDQHEVSKRVAAETTFYDMWHPDGIKNIPESHRPFYQANPDLFKAEPLGKMLQSPRVSEGSPQVNIVRLSEDHVLRIFNIVDAERTVMGHQNTYMSKIDALTGYLYARIIHLKGPRPDEMVEFGTMAGWRGRFGGEVPGIENYLGALIRPSHRLLVASSVTPYTIATTHRACLDSFTRESLQVYMMYLSQRTCPTRFSCVHGLDTFANWHTCVLRQGHSELAFGGTQIHTQPVVHPFDGYLHITGRGQSQWYEGGCDVMVCATSQVMPRLFALLETEVFLTT